jgi:acyl-coenzyme A synthetase/AMP-(fatty) acid ligase
MQHPAETIFFWARATPDRLAVIEPQMAITYRALADAIEAVETHIRHYNFVGGSPVAVAIDHPARQLAVCIALIRCGIPAAPVNNETLPHLAAAGIDCLIVEGDVPAPTVGRSIRFDDSWLRQNTASQDSPRPVARPAATSHADMIFLTPAGTDTTKTIAVSAAAFIDSIELLPVSGQATFMRTLVVPALASQSGFMRAVMLMHAGRSVCFAPNAQARIALINTYRVECLVASAQQAATLLNAVETDARQLMPSLREIRIADRLPSGDLARRLQARLCRHVWTEYSATDAGLLAFAHYDRIASVPDAVGFLAPGVEMQIVNEDDGPVTIGEHGLVRYRTRFLTETLADHHPDKANDSSGPWWYPGDLGRLTDDGILCISGRVDGAGMPGVGDDRQMAR